MVLLRSCCLRLLVASTLQLRAGLRGIEGFKRLPRGERRGCGPSEGEWPEPQISPRTLSVILTN